MTLSATGIRLRTARGYRLLSNPNKPNDRSLLPDNSTVFEESFEHAIADLMKSDNHYVWLTDPMTTDSKLLDIMAKEAGVVDWFNSDLESDKRLSISNATAIHQKSGTRSGVKDALEALGCVAVVKRSDEIPYHINIDNLVTDKVLTNELLNRLYERVKNTKSERDTFTLTVGRLLEGRVYKSSQVSIGRKIMIEAAQ